MGKEPKTSRLVLPVLATEAHRGKALEVDREKETITILGPEGQRLGTAGWGALIEHLAVAAPPPPEESRTHPRASFLSKVRYRPAGGGAQIEARATGVGGGGLFIESASPLPVGSELEVEFTLPERSADWFKARGAVAWVCPKPDQYTFASGMGIRFTWIAEETRARVVAFVKALKRKEAAT